LLAGTLTAEKKQTSVTDQNNQLHLHEINTTDTDTTERLVVAEKTRNALCY